MIRRPPRSTLFPYTTLFRSRAQPLGLDLPALGDIAGDLGKTPQLARFVAHGRDDEDRKSTRLNSSHQIISYAVFCLKKKKISKIYSSYYDASSFSPSVF